MKTLKKYARGVLAVGVLLVLTVPLAVGVWVLDTSDKMKQKAWGWSV